MADEEKIFSLNQASKTVFTFNMNPDRFYCKLSETAGKHHDRKRLYLQTLPYYIEDREKRQKIVTEGFKNVNSIPPRKLDFALDPIKLQEAAENQRNFQELLN